MSFIESLFALKVRNSSEQCGRPLWDETGMSCCIYASCGDPCEKPCVLCSVWEGHGGAEKNVIDAAKQIAR
jgi:hypothetical protein